MKHRWGSVLAVLCCLVMGLTGCRMQPQKTGRIQVVCTIFPEYDWVRQIVGDAEGVEVTLLVKGGTDLHSYQPSVKDIARIAQADVFCYVGGTSDSWVTEVLDMAENPDAIAVPMLEAADAEEEVTVEGMQEEKHHHHHDEDEHHDEEEAQELDEHVWLSLRRAQLICQAISDALCEADPANADTYRANTAAYQKQLQALDAQYTDMVEQEAVRDTFLVADRFPFRYLAQDYGLQYYAAFAGCSAETEASFATIAFLSEKVEALRLPCVLTVENSSKALAKTVWENAGNRDGEILTLDSLQSVTQTDIDNGVTYLSEMQKNLDVLRTALTEVR